MANANDPRLGGETLELPGVCWPTTTGMAWHEQVLERASTCSCGSLPCQPSRLTLCRVLWWPMWAVAGGAPSSSWHRATPPRGTWGTTSRAHPHFACKDGANVRRLSLRRLVLVVNKPVFHEKTHPEAIPSLLFRRTPAPCSPQAEPSPRAARQTGLSRKWLS
jgi:hypothetical protein